MEEEKDCEQIYQEYLVAKDRTSAQINGLASRGTYSVIDGNEVLKVKTLARELVCNCAEFLREKPGVFYSVGDDADEICECSHFRNLHNGIRSYKDGEPNPKHKKGRGCRRGECECRQYILGN